MKSDLNFSCGCDRWTGQTLRLPGFKNLFQQTARAMFVFSLAQREAGGAGYPLTGSLASVLLSLQQSGRCTGRIAKFAPRALHGEPERLPPHRKNGARSNNQENAVSQQMGWLSLRIILGHGKRVICRGVVLGNTSGGGVIERVALLSWAAFSLFDLWSLPRRLPLPGQDVELVLHVTRIAEVIAAQPTRAALRAQLKGRSGLLADRGGVGVHGGSLR